MTGGHERSEEPQRAARQHGGQAGVAVGQREAGGRGARRVWSRRPRRGPTCTTTPGAGNIKKGPTRPRKVGYIHVPDMQATGLNEFAKH